MASRPTMLTIVLISLLSAYFMTDFCDPLCSKETRELPGQRDNASNNARCMQARKTTHGLDGQHQDVDKTPWGRVTQDSDQRRKYVHGVANPWIEDG